MIEYFIIWYCVGLLSSSFIYYVIEGVPDIFELPIILIFSLLGPIIFLILLYGFIVQVIKICKDKKND